MKNLPSLTPTNIRLNNSFFTCEMSDLPSKHASPSRSPSTDSFVFSILKSDWNLSLNEFNQAMNKKRNHTTKIHFYSLRHIVEHLSCFCKFHVRGCDRLWHHFREVKIIILLEIRMQIERKFSFGKLVIARRNRLRRHEDVNREERITLSQINWIRVEERKCFSSIPPILWRTLPISHLIRLIETLKLLM